MLVRSVLAAVLFVVFALPASAEPLTLLERPPVV